MSNFPPVPHFGTPYVSEGNNNSNAGTYNASVSQHPYQARTQSSSYAQAHAPSQTNGVPPSSRANANSFHANTQGIAQGNGINGALVEPTNRPSHGFNSQQHLPVSISYDTLNFSHSSNQALASPANPSNHTVSPSINPGVQQITNFPNPQSPNKTSAAQSVSDLEDGEVGDEETDEPLNISASNKMGFNFSRASQHNGTEGSRTTTERFSNRRASPVYELSSTLNHGSLFNAGNQSPTSSQSLQPQPSDRNNNTLNPAPSLQPLNDTPASSNSAFKNHGTEQNATEVPLLARKRQEAKQALIDLHNYGVDFNQIVNHGMDPGILRLLYAEADIPIIAPQSESAIHSGAKNQGAVIEEQDQSKKTQSNIPPQRISMPLDKDLDKPNIHSSSTIPTYSEKVVKPNTAAPGKPTSSNILAKMSSAKTSNSKPSDRKEYIARMLAAKASKPTTTATPLVNSKASTAAETTTPAEPAISSTAANSDLATANTEAQEPAQRIGKESNDILPQTLKDDVDAETKRKAQTDLARQKIEALKLQQETRKVISSDLAHQKPALTETTLQMPMVAPVTVPRPPISTRQSSYFSPVSQKAPFSIPGLFMTAEPSHPVKPTESGPGESFPPSTGETSGVPVQSPPKLIAAPVPKSRTEMVNEILTDGSTAEGIKPRKRQKAADFLDSPSTRVKGPLGQQKDSSVIIEISEDEFADASDADSMIVDSADGAGTVSKMSQLNSITTKKQKPFQDAPPLSEFPSRRRTPVETPPAMPVTKQAKGLKTKEMEIELMNRKIAELEQRVNAKKTISRAHTPGQSSSAIVSPSFNPQDVRDKSSTIMETSVEPRGGSSDSVFSEKKALTAVDEMSAITAEKTLQEIEKAKAEAERSLATDTAKALDEEQHILQVSSRTVTDEEPHPREVEQHLEVLAPDADRISHNSHLQEEISADLLENEQSESYELPRTRRMAIESGLPVLDATMEKTRQKLDSLRNEIEELEAELQKGIEGRRALLEELESLSQEPEAQKSRNNEDSTEPSQRVDQTSKKLENQAPRRDLSPMEVEDGSSLQQPPTPEAPSAFQEQADLPNSVTATIPPPRSPSEQILDEDLEEDVMDISRSEVDDGEVSDDSLMILDAQDKNILESTEDEENYEPPTDISDSQLQQEIDLPAEHPIVEDESPDGPIGDSLVDVPEAESLQPHENFISNADAHTDKQMSKQSPPLADVSDADDYEPPEPLPLVPESTLHPPVLLANSSISPTASVDIIDDLVPARPGSPPNLGHLGLPGKATESESEKETAPESNHKAQYFTPYESPLKQFKSFRNHPEYLDGVSQGFRSLTYSHAMKPDIPICRYEIDGVCNDASCQSQHFKTMGLSDERILVDLGALPERSDFTAVDVSVYTDGLRKLIQDIRNRKVKDVNEVASEITAYRRRFLGDFRILSL